ncbi:MAG TPA: radical SAM protein [Polyangiaceae bacterium]|nr:radical SAM protein [Polyangiaceae bacterium]
MNRRRPLDVHDHDRAAAGMRYVYPVVSRRAGGLSLGVNLNPNAACNWRCVYCQVPGLSRGVGPAIDLARLGQELDRMLAAVLDGDFLERAVPAPYRRLADVAFSGDGEPTSSPDFDAAVALVLDRLGARALLGRISVVVITNGSFVRKPRVAAALARLAAADGEVWFKLDAGTREEIARTNGVPLDPDTHVRRLLHAAARCRTWVQTCLFARDGAPPNPAALDRYVALLERALARGAALAGVHLYTLARPSRQPEAERLTALGVADLEPIAARLRALGLVVRVSV